MTESTKTNGTGAMVAWWVGLAGHLVGAIWYAASGLVAPPWAVVLLLVIWVALFVVGLRLRTRRPWWMLAVPVLDVVIWVAIVSAGEAFLGWTA
jgi:hypothetical protein